MPADMYSARGSTRATESRRFTAACAKCCHSDVSRCGQSPQIAVNDVNARRGIDQTFFGRQICRKLPGERLHSPWSARAKYSQGE